MSTKKSAAARVSGIKATWSRVTATRAAVTLLKRIRPRYSSVLFLTPSICVKYGTFQHLSEAASMQFIAEKTTIPVPKVHCAFERKGVTYIVMSKLPGSPVGHEWTQRPAESKAKLLKQLRDYILQMRKLRPAHDGKVCGVDGGKLYDGRLPNGASGFGPFDSIDDFHNHLRDGTKASPGQIPEVNELIEWHEETQHRSRSTHGDLNSMNILVRDDSITGIVDWATAGWYPEYWEYTTAESVNPFNEFWRAEVPKFLDAYHDEARMESIRQKYFGDF